MENEFRAVPFTNEFGQVIEPGETVVYAGLSYKTTYFRKGKFAGVYYGEVKKYHQRRDENGDIVKDARGYAIWDTSKAIEPVGTKIVEVVDKVWNRETKEYETAVRSRPAILQYNRIFKLATEVDQMAGSKF